MAKKENSEKYKNLIYLLANETKYAKGLAEFSSASDCDFLAKILLQIATDAKNQLHLIKELISYELHKYQHMPQNIFRSNSLASKILGIYVRNVGKEYLKLVLGELLDKLLTEDASLEIDSGKLRDVTNPEEIIEKNRVMLQGWCEKFIDRIMEPEMMKTMPAQVRIVASYIAEISDSLQLDTPILIGSYLMLRFFNPAIATPDVYDIIEPKKKSKVGQRNLILISKIIQNLANNVKFGNKEVYMICMNEFIAKKTGPMRNFLISIVDKEMSQSQSTAFSSVKMEDIDVQRYDEKDLLKLHKLFYEEAKDVACFFMTYGAKNVEPANSIMSSCLEVINMLELLGPPAATGSSSVTSGTEVNTILEKRDQVFAGICETVHNTFDQIDSQKYDNKYFFYEGKPAIDGKNVYYFIGSRVTDEMFTTERGHMIYHLVRVLGENINKPFALVLDLSFVGIFNKQKELLSTVFEEYSFFFTQNQQKNLQDIFIIHAGQHFNTIYALIKNTSKNLKFKRRVKELSEWNQLIEFIEPENILLPEESKLSIPQTYRIIKVNSKGKHQERQLKITPKSILNIDPKNGIVKNERLLSEIEEISAPTANNELHMKFSPSKSSKSAPGYFTDEEGNPEDLLFRRYICSSFQERQVLLEDLFETTVRAQFCNSIQAYQAIIIHNKKTKERLFKFSNDSIFIVDRRVIKLEIPFVSVENAKIDPSKKNSVVLKIRQEEGEMEVQTSNSKELLNSINEGIKRTQEVIKQRSASNTMEMYILAQKQAQLLKKQEADKLRQEQEKAEAESQATSTSSASESKEAETTASTASTPMDASAQPSETPAMSPMETVAQETAVQ